MSADAGERLERILRVMPLLVDKDEVPVDEVKRVAGVDALTLLDDLRALTERDDEPGGFVETVSIFFESNSVSVHSRHFGRPTRITLPELCALELGLAILAADTPPNERAVIDSARRRLREAIVAMPASAARADLWYASGPRVPNERILGTLREAVQAQTKARIVYRRGDAATSSERVVHPYAVLPVRGAWFLIAYCERNDGMRFFRVDRIGSVTLLEEQFERPSGLALDEILSAERIFSGRASEQLVVRYSPRIARWIAEREAGDAEADGSFIVRHPLADDAWAVRHVLQYGPEAEIIEPTRIRERVAATLHSMLGAS